MVPLYAACSVPVPSDIPAPCGADELLVVPSIAVGPWLLVVACDGAEAVARAAVGATGERPTSEHADTVTAAVKINAPEKT
jgi:hypothetical protein